MSLIVSVKKGFFTASQEESFDRILGTPLGSRVVRPYFGSKLYELIDKPMDEEWRLNFTQYTLEAFYNENYEPWDERLIPTGVSIVAIDATTGSVTAKIDFEAGSVEFDMGGF